MLASLVAFLLLFGLRIGGPGCSRCGDELPEEMRPAYQQARANLIQVSALFREKSESGRWRTRKVTGVGVLLDPSRGDVVTDRRLVEGADRVSTWFIGNSELLPRRARLLGCDDDSGFAVLRTGPVDVDCIAMPAALVTTEHGRETQALLISYHVEEPRSRVVVGKLGCTQADSVEGRRGTFVHDPDSLLAPGGLVAAATDGRPIGWVSAEPFPSTREARMARAVLEARGEPQSLFVLPMLSVAGAFERIVCAHAADPEPEPSDTGRPWIGITAETLGDDDALRHHLGIRGPAIVVEDVFHDSPAFRAGLRSHHIIVAVNGEAFEDDWALGRVLRRLEPGERFELGVIQAGRLETVSITLEGW